MKTPPVPPYDLEPAELTAWQEAYSAGHRHAQGIARQIAPRVGECINPGVECWGLGSVVTADNAKAYHQALCYASEEASRQYSPFEAIAARLNSEEVLPAAYAWDAFDSGAADAIGEDLSRYSNSDYSA